MAPRPAFRLLASVAILAGAAGCSTTDDRLDPDAPPGPPYLVEYREASYRAQGEELGEPVSTDEVLRTARDCGLLMFGDLHDDVLLHATHRDLCDRLAATDTPVVLVLEAIALQDDELIADYLDGTSTLEEVRHRIRLRWPRSWLEPSRVHDSLAWKSLLRRARENRWPVYGLEEAPRRPLLERDGFIAANILRIRALHPDRLVVAILGQAHLSGEGSAGDRLSTESVRVFVRPSTALAEAAASEDGADPFSRLPALGDRAFLLRP